MAAADAFLLLYPYYAVPTDPRFVSDTVRAELLAMAAYFRPLCLPAVQQDAAQAHYAAYLLDARAAALSGTYGSTTVIGATPGGALIEETEGSVTRRYSPPTATKTVTTTGATNTAPTTPYTRWAALNALCSTTNPTVPASAAAVRGGALLTGWGYE